MIEPLDLRHVEGLQTIHSALLSFKTKEDLWKKAFKNLFEKHGIENTSDFYPSCLSHRLQILFQHYNNLYNWFGIIYECDYYKTNYDITPTRNRRTGTSASLTYLILNNDEISQYNKTKEHYDIFLKVTSSMPMIKKCLYDHTNRLEKIIGAYLTSLLPPLGEYYCARHILAEIYRVWYEDQPVINEIRRALENNSLDSLFSNRDAIHDFIRSFEMVGEFYKEENKRIVLKEMPSGLGEQESKLLSGSPSNVDLKKTLYYNNIVLKLKANNEVPWLSRPAALFNTSANAREKRPLVYVSYARRDRDAQDQPDQETSGVVDREQIVDELCEMLAEEDKILVGRDKKLLKTGDSIEDFAGEIAKSGLILAVISKKSLRSKWCMKDELLQAFRRRNYSQTEFGFDVLPLILDDAEADFKDETSLIDLWSERADRERKKLEKSDPERKLSPESWRAVDEMEELRGRLLDLMRVFKIRSMPRGAEAIREEGFQEIRQLVLKRLQEKDI